MWAIYNSWKAMHVNADFKFNWRLQANKGAKQFASYSYWVNMSTSENISRLQPELIRNAPEDSNYACTAAYSASPDFLMEGLEVKPFNQIENG